MARGDNASRGKAAVHAGPLLERPPAVGSHESDQGVRERMTLWVHDLAGGANTAVATGGGQRCDAKKKQGE